jgi:hypothetical protein
MANPMDRYMVADGERGWEVWRFAGPWWAGGPYEVIAADLSEEDAAEIARREAEKDEAAAATRH